MSGLYGNAVMAPAALKTVIIEDTDGNELTGVVTGEEVVFTATDKQVADGFVYAGDNGVSTGSREFLSYRTTRGYKLVDIGDIYTIQLSDNDQYQYTQLQCLISPLSNPYMATMSVLDNGVYSVSDGSKLSDVTIDISTKSINLNISNTSNEQYVIYYFTYRQEEL